MATYRIYFRSQDEQIVGRDDFEADSDARALVVGRTLRDACSDKCAAFEVWQGTRHVDMPCRNWAGLGAERVHARVEEIVLERELAIRTSNWVVADSARLLEETGRLLSKSRART